MTIWAILPAAGIGRRMGSITPKQYLTVNGTPVISCALQRLAAVSAIEKIVVVLHPDDKYWQTLNSALGADSDSGFEIHSNERIRCATGAQERCQSVLNGLDHIESEAKADDWVLVHDAVRPCVRTSDIEKLISELHHHPVGGLLGSPVDNTLKQVDTDGNVVATIDRNKLWNALTPQMFRYEILRNAIRHAVSQREQVTDEAAAIERLGHSPKMVAGNKDNIKITHEADLILASNILKSQGATV